MLAALSVQTTEENGDRRELDRLGAKKIYIHAPEQDGVGLAVYNRLVRAAAFHIEKV